MFVLIVHPIIRKESLKPLFLPSRALKSYSSVKPRSRMSPRVSHRILKSVVYSLLINPKETQRSMRRPSGMSTTVLPSTPSTLYTHPYSLPSQ